MMKARFPREATREKQQENTETGAHRR